MQATPRTDARFHRAAVFMLAYTIAVVLWGAYVRATGSGAGCGSHWPLCNGQVVPVIGAMATFIEFMHRITSGLAWFLALGLYVFARRLWPGGHVARRGAAAVLFFMTTEALVGAGLVLFRMVADNPSTARGAWVSTHLINTFLLLISEALTVFWAAGGASLRGRVRGPLGFATVVSFLGITLIGVSGVIAALGDTLFPVTSFVDGVRMDMAEGAHLWLRLRWLHPLFAVGLGAWMFVSAAALRWNHAATSVRRAAGAVMALVVTQIALGFLNFFLSAPVLLQLLHLLVADLLLVALTFLGAAALTTPAESPATPLQSEPLEA